MPLSRREFLKLGAVVGARMVLPEWLLGRARAAGADKELGGKKSEYVSVTSMSVRDTRDGGNYDRSLIINARHAVESVRFAMSDYVANWFGGQYSDFSIVRVGEVSLVTDNPAFSTSFRTVEVMINDAKTMDGQPVVLNLLETTIGGQTRYIPIINVYWAAEGMRITPEAMLFVPDTLQGFDALNSKLKGSLAVNPANRDVYVKPASSPDGVVAMNMWYLRYVEDGVRTTEFASPGVPSTYLVETCSETVPPKQMPLKDMLLNPGDLGWTSWLNIAGGYDVMAGWDQDQPRQYAVNPGESLSTSTKVLGVAEYRQDTNVWVWN